MSYKGYATFEDVENVRIRTWNRVATAFNIYEDKGDDFLVGYLEQFSEKDQGLIRIVFERLVTMRKKMGAKEGYEYVKRELCYREPEDDSAE